MRRLLVGVLSFALILVLAPPSAAKVKERDAEGTTSFMLNPTCDPSPGGNCPFDPDTGILELGLSNPGMKVGTFKGTQRFDGTLFINVFNGTFTMTGSVVFEGRVKACGHGTVEFDVTGSGFLTEEGSGAFFETNEQTIVGGTLPIEGVVRELGAGTGNEDGTAGTLPYEGEYTCDQRGRGN